MKDIHIDIEAENKSTSYMTHSFKEAIDWLKGLEAMTYECYECGKEFISEKTFNPHPVCDECLGDKREISGKEIGYAIERGDLEADEALKMTAKEMRQWIEKHDYDPY